jgi:hypothetical protein
LRSFAIAPHPSSVKKFDGNTQARFNKRLVNGYKNTEKDRKVMSE